MQLTLVVENCGGRGFQFIMPKRKRVVSASEQASYTCILHVASLKDYGQFTNFANVKGSAEEKLRQLIDIRNHRLQQAQDSPYRMQSVCDQIPETLPENLKSNGYHRQCYQRFTANLHLLENDTSPTSVSYRHHSPRKHSSTFCTTPLFPDECIFCGKIEIKDAKRKTERPEKFSSFRNKQNGWEEIELRAEKMELHDLYRQVKNKDLFACEAKHHPSCFRSFRTAYANYERSLQRALLNDDTEQASLLAAHDKAFSEVVSAVKSLVVEKNQVVKLSSLRLIYIEQLAKNGYENKNYRSEKLLRRLDQDELREQIQFVKVDTEKVNNGLPFWLICSAKITVTEALGSAYILGSSDKYQEVANLLRCSILDAFKNEKQIPWPFTADDMILHAEDILPVNLIRFLGMLLTGKDQLELNMTMKRVIFSIGQDICHAVSERKWKMPKQILLCMTVRHLFRSKLLTKILHRLGHSESYDFGLELETGLAKALNESSSLLTPQIITGEGNLVFHCEWDNLNKITTNVHGNNIVNSAGGIMVQEVKQGYESSKDRKLPVIPKAKQRSLQVETPEMLTPLHFTRVGPSFPEDSSFTPPHENDQVFDQNAAVYYIWFFSRYIGSSGKQPIPGLGGFTSATGIQPTRKSTVDYFTPIHQPITDNAVVYELLKRSEAATSEVGQKFVLNTFDLGVAMKALPIVWRWPEEFANHVISIGPFHTSMNYIGMLTGHKMRGSGYAEILFESQLVTTGSVKGVLSGKSYAKALFCLKSVCEAMERLLLEQYMKEEEISIGDPTVLLNIAKACTPENLSQAMQDPTIMTFMTKYQEYERKVQGGHLGKTARFWMSFIQHCHLIFMLLHSVKTNNIQLFHKCNGDMAELFFSFDGHNYSRYSMIYKLYSNIKKHKDYLI